MADGIPFRDRAPEGRRGHLFDGYRRNVALVLLAGLLLSLALAVFMRSPCCRQDWQKVVLALVGPLFWTTALAIHHALCHDEGSPDPDDDRRGGAIRRCRLGPDYHSHLAAELLVGGLTAVLAFAALFAWLLDRAPMDEALFGAAWLGSVLSFVLCFSVGERHQARPGPDSG